MKSHIRRFILLTLSHAGGGNRSHYTPHSVVSKIRSLFSCESVVVAKELHKGGGHHYHVGILNNTASRHTATNTLRESFPEFEGRQLNVSFHRSWNTVCDYILKQDGEPHCWGAKKEGCLERVDRKSRDKESLGFVSRMRRCKTWEEVLRDDILFDRVTKSFTSMKQAFNELNNIKE